MNITAETPSSTAQITATKIHVRFSIYIIPIGATLGAVSWFYVMKKEDLLAAVNTGSKKQRGRLWYSIGRYLYVPLAILLCCVALVLKVAF